MGNSQLNSNGCVWCSPMASVWPVLLFSRNHRFFSWLSLSVWKSATATATGSYSFTVTGGLISHQLAVSSILKSSIAICSFSDVVTALTDDFETEFFLRRRPQKPRSLHITACSGFRLQASGFRDGLILHLLSASISEAHTLTLTLVLFIYPKILPPGSTADREIQHPHHDSYLS